MTVKRPGIMQWVVWIAFVVGLSGCQPSPTASRGLTVGQKEQVSLLVRLDAPTFIKREGWADYQPIEFGAFVYPTDLLKTDGQITLLCSDLHSLKTLTQLERNPCPPGSGSQVLSYDQMQYFSGARAAELYKIPYIVYPRNTAILETRPTLRWNDTGATAYTVEIWQGAEIVWKQAKVQGSFLVYPTGAPELSSGREYQLVVTDDDTGLKSTSDPSKGLGFQLVPADQRAELEGQRQAISGLADLDPTAQKMALALYYSQVRVGGRGLWGEVGGLLREVAEAQAESPSVHLRLAESYAGMKLWNEAQAAYERTITSAQAINDLESQADAYAALWYITNDPSQAEQAIRFYDTLGARDKADTLKKARTP